MWKVLELCYELLGLEKRATLREIYYILVSDALSLFQVQDQVNAAIQGRWLAWSSWNDDTLVMISTLNLFFFLNQSLAIYCGTKVRSTAMKILICISDVVALLHCSRHSLGIIASSRGALVGRLLIQVKYSLLFPYFRVHLFIGQ